MPKKRSPKRPSGPRKRGSQRGRTPHGISAKRTKTGDAWTLVHPKCVRERAEDMQEVREIIEAGELDVAIDELRWLLGSCSEFIEAHELLAELTIRADNNVPLARGHFGFGYHLGLRALQRASMPTPVPYRLPANQALFHCGRGLVWCLCRLEKQEMAREVVEQLVAMDPSDPLELKAMFDSLQTGDLPIVEL